MNAEKYLNDWNEKSKIISFAKENKIEYFWDMLIYCKNNNYDWFKLLVDTPNLYKYFKR